MSAVPVRGHDHRLWSLWDMLRFYAEKFVAALNALSDFEAMLRGNHVQQIMNSRHTLQHAMQHLDTLISQLDELGLGVTAKKARMLKAQIADVACPPDVFASVAVKTLEETRERLEHELDGRLIYHIAAAHSNYLDQETPLFGDNVALKFPKASYEISEAGKCLALRRSTACVFHLMRAVEICIHSLAGSLEQTLKPNWGWRKILCDVLEPAINGLPEATEQERERKRELQQIRTYLHAVRLGFRNDTMHPNDVYTEEEAEQIIKNVETFMKHLAGYL